jgi:hypothetical protein
MNPREAYIRCDGKRNRYLEKYFIKDLAFAYFYARDVIQGRWIEAENIISTNSYCTYLYAKNVIKGKLPENMHNAMLIHADGYAKEYFDYIKNKPQP